MSGYLNSKEQAAIDRRRKQEEERKQRIFDPKARTKGVRRNISDTRRSQCSLSIQSFIRWISMLLKNKSNKSKKPNKRRKTENWLSVILSYYPICSYLYLKGVTPFPFREYLFHLLFYICLIAFLFGCWISQFE